MGSGGVKFNLMVVVGDRRAALKEQQGGLAEDSTEYVQIQSDLEQQELKRKQWKLENERRRHNYVPLCVELIKQLARQGKLPDLVTEAKDRMEAKRQKK